MEKALEILESIFIDEQNTMCVPSTFIPLDLFNAINELQEAMKPKTCEGCKYGVHGCDSTGMELGCTLVWHCARGNGFPDRYEAKEK